MFSIFSISRNVLHFVILGGVESNDLTAIFYLKMLRCAHVRCALKNIARLLCCYIVVAFKRSTDAGERNYNATTVVTTHGGPPAIVAPALPALDSSSRLVLPLCPVFLQHASQIYSKAHSI